MIYHFWIKATDEHDKETTDIEAYDLREARKVFDELFPQDAENVSEIYEENTFAPIWSK
jgi:hypothetical protein